MSAALFIDAISSMQGLTSQMKDHLISLAENLSEQDRVRAIQKLQPMNAALVASKEESIEIHKEGIVRLQTIRKEGLGALRARAEEGEQDSLDDIERSIGNA